MASPLKFAVGLVAKLGKKLGVVMVAEDATKLAQDLIKKITPRDTDTSLKELIQKVPPAPKPAVKKVAKKVAKRVTRRSRG